MKATLFLLCLCFLLMEGHRGHAASVKSHPAGPVVQITAAHPDIETAATHTPIEESAASKKALCQTAFPEQNPEWLIFDDEEDEDWNNALIKKCRPIAWWHIGSIPPSEHYCFIPVTRESSPQPYSYIAQRVLRI